MTEQGPGYGAAILAMIGVGVYKDVKTAVDKLVKVKETIKPDKELTLKYDKKYQVFKTLYPTLKDLFHNALSNA